MNRTKFLRGDKYSKVNHSAFKNKFGMEYISLHDVDDNLICDYIEITYIEKVTRHEYDADGNLIEHITDWHANLRYASQTKCTKCFNFDLYLTDLFGYDDSFRFIKVDNSIDMLPLYMKWALKFKGIKFEPDGDIVGESYKKLDATLNGLYKNINEKDRLKNFTECRCTKCGKEWIVFEEENENPT